MRRKLGLKDGRLQMRAFNKRQKLFRDGGASILRKRREKEHKKRAEKDEI